MQTSTAPLSTFRIVHNDGIMHIQAKHKAEMISSLHNMYPDLRIIAMAYIDNKGTPHWFHK